MTALLLLLLGGCLPPSTGADDDDSAGDDDDATSDDDDSAAGDPCLTLTFDPTEEEPGNGDGYDAILNAGPITLELCGAGWIDHLEPGHTSFHWAGPEVTAVGAPSELAEAWASEWSTGFVLLEVQADDSTPDNPWVVLVQAGGGHHVLSAWGRPLPNAQPSLDAQGDPVLGSFVTGLHTTVSYIPDLATPADVSDAVWDLWSEMDFAL